MEKEKNIMMVNQNLKENIYMEKDGMVKDIIKIIIIQNIFYIKVKDM